ncbi:MAG TPA: hypothetical protein VHZ95_21775, partial [Polyangiales bacterium]|nr:hypothetical protein [Polyangiales bacterium]
VFISPSPPAGVRTSTMRLFWGAWRTAHRFGFAPKIMRPNRRTTKRLVFNVMPIEQHAIARGAMVYESGHAFNDLGNVLIDETKIQAPVLTIAATRDRLVPARSVRLTGRKYAAIGGEFKEYRNHGHWLYAEPNWEEPAGDIYAWLSKVTQSRDTDREVHSRTDSDRETQPRTDTDRAALE